MTGYRRRESHAERRQRRAEVDDPQVVIDAAARFLEVRSRSVDEVRRHLSAAGYRPELIDAAIARLLELHVLDDEAFARLWLESRDRSRPRSETALRRELSLKGIDRVLADELLGDRRSGRGQAGEDGDAGSPGPDLAAAQRLLRKKASALARLADPRDRRRRAYALLARNGFDPDTVRMAIASELSEGDEDGAAD